MISKFKLGSKDYRVEYVEDIDDSGLGRTYSPLLLIKIAKYWNGKKLPEESMEQTLWHEIVHAILDDLGYLELSNDETFVQGFSLMLHQYDISRNNTKDILTK